MKFSLWLETKDKILYESILSEMDRRDFLKSLTATALGASVPSVSLGESPKKEFLKEISVSSNDNPQEGTFTINFKVPIKSNKDPSVESYYIISQIIKELNEFIAEKRFESRKMKKDPFININEFVTMIKGNNKKAEFHVRFLLDPKKRIIENYLITRISSKAHSETEQKQGFHSLSFVFFYSHERPIPDASKNPFKPPFSK